MAVDKLVDSTQLNTDLTAVANAIRAKSGGSTPLVFPGGFVSEIGSIQTGGGGGNEDALISRSLSGSYTNSRVSAVGEDALRSCRNLTSVTFPAATTVGAHAFSFCTNLVTASAPMATQILQGTFEGCSKLTTFDFAAAPEIANSYNKYVSAQKKKLYPEILQKPERTKYLLDHSLIPLSDLAMCLDMADKNPEIQMMLLEYQQYAFSEKDKAKQRKKEGSGHGTEENFYFGTPRRQVRMA